MRGTMKILLIILAILIVVVFIYSKANGLSFIKGLVELVVKFIQFCLNNQK